MVVGLALEQQILPEGQEVPTDASDWTLDALVAGDKRVLRRSSKSLGEDRNVAGESVLHSPLAGTPYSQTGYPRSKGSTARRGNATIATPE